MSTSESERARYIALLLRLGARVDEGRFRRVFCNRDMNLQGTRWVGFDMDYTLAVYNQANFDALCHCLTLDRLVERFAYDPAIRAIPYDPTFAIRGLVLDKTLGHVLKMDAHGHVEVGYHGFQRVPHEEIESYRRLPPVLGSPRYMGIDTLFELPEIYLYSALVDFQERRGSTPDFERLADDVREAVDGIHADGTLKNRVIDDVPNYIRRDRRLPATLHRLRSAGKRLFLMTNSYFEYTDAVMSYLLADGPAGYAGWRTYFDIIVTGASKPNFFRKDRPFLILDADGRTIGEENERLKRGAIYQHGNLKTFEASIGADGDQILYVGDHIYGDIVRSKRDSRWRTAMIIPELEHELRNLSDVTDLVDSWSDTEEELRVVRDAMLFENELRHALGSPDAEGYDAWTPEEREEWEREAATMINSDRLARRQRELVERIRTIADDVDARFHPRWGPLMKAGNEHSSFGQLVERYADLYTSRVTNFLAYSTAQYFRAPRTPLPHELDTL